MRTSQKNIQELSGINPDNTNTAFDMHKVIANLADPESILEIRAKFATELITCFAAIDGQKTAIIANNSSSKGGIYFPASCRKATRFISICSAFGIPIIFLADSGGFMVGSAVEQAGIIKEAALMMQTVANAKVAKLAAVVRRDYTAGVYAMSGGGMGNDGFIALPTASISIYGKVVADKIAASGDSEEERENRNKMLEAAQDPAEYLKNGLIDAIVEPDDLKLRISQFLSEHSKSNRAAHTPIILV
jgi:acetyl-CoA carboxylase carboxyltransferase component